MGKYISFGKFNNYFYYIILTFFFALLNDFLYGFNYLDIFIEVKIIDTKAQDYFSWHYFIHQIFNYFGTFIFATLFYKYEIFSSRSENERESLNPASQQIILIHNNAEEFQTNNYNFFILIIIIILMIVVEELLVFYIYSLKDLDFWMVELIAITHFILRF